MDSLHRLRQRAVLAALWLSAPCAWAQAVEIAVQIGGLAPTEQRQLQALIATRESRDGARLFTDTEVRTVRTVVPATAIPLPRTEIEQLSLHIDKIFGPSAMPVLRIVNRDRPIFTLCLGCPDGLSNTCHNSSSQLLRLAATTMLARHPHLAEAVGGLYLAPAGGRSQLAGTFFVSHGHIITNVHVLLRHTRPAGQPDVRTLKPGFNVEVVLGGDGIHRVNLPVDALWRRHPNLDLILTAWPAGVVAPTGLTLATGPLAINTPVALLGFPTVNTNTDRREDIATAFGDCPDTIEAERRMAISMGRITSASGVDLEHDANTMGNSSGSPLIRISDGTLVGVHSGDALWSVRNSAVAARALVELMTAFAP